MRRSGEIRVWDPKTGIQKGQPLRGHKKWVRYYTDTTSHLYGFSYLRTYFTVLSMLKYVFVEYRRGRSECIQYEHI